MVVEHQSLGSAAGQATQDDGKAVGGHQLGLGANLFQGAEHQLCHLLHALPLGGDAGLPAKDLQPLDGTLHVVVDIGQNIVHGVPLQT